MALPSNDRGRPPAGAASDVSHHGDDSIVPLPSDETRHPRAVAPAYVIFVTTSDGTLRRRVYLSLHSAIKAQERAEAKGHTFDLVLCELVPVSHRPALLVGAG